MSRCCSRSLGGEGVPRSSDSVWQVSRSNWARSRRTSECAAQAERRPGSEIPDPRESQIQHLVRLVSTFQGAGVSEPRDVITLSARRCLRRYQRRVQRPPFVPHVHAADADASEAPVISYSHSSSRFTCSASSRVRATIRAAGARRAQRPSLFTRLEPAQSRRRRSCRSGLRGKPEDPCWKIGEPAPRAGPVLIQVAARV